MVAIMTTSAVRSALRDRLTTAMRERDRTTVSTMRTAIAALENAEAVPTSVAPGIGGGPDAETDPSRHVAGAMAGVGAAEAERLVLDEASEAAILRGEVESLLEAARQYEAGGRDEPASQARAAAHELSAVVHSALGTTWG
jgi:hypothetical protein